MTHITTDKIELCQNKGTAVTLGNFDGIHLGHIKLIDTVKKDAADNCYQSVVFSFFPHPISIFKNNTFQTIQTSEEKAFILDKMGVDYFIEYPFDFEVAKIEPEFFISEILIKKLNCKELVVGEDYHFGKSQKGNKELLLKLSKELGFEVKIIPHLMVGPEKISSSFVRQLILEKNFTLAEELLGRPYFILGNVKTGKKIGRSIGIPTVNISVPEYKLLPPNGVYCTKLLHDNILYNAITNVGTNPTVDGKSKTVESYIFDFDKTIYGEEIKLDFYKWVRHEKKFENLEALKEQISSDVQFGVNFFQSIKCIN